jgi:hypothetical protein
MNTSTENKAQVQSGEILLAPFGGEFRRFVLQGQSAPCGDVAVRFLNNDGSLGDWWLLPAGRVGLSARLGVWSEPPAPPPPPPTVWSRLGNVFGKAFWPKCI